MTWQLYINKNVLKKIRKLPVSIQECTETLFDELRQFGPICTTWSHFGKLGKNIYHCHIKKGKPTYVAVWKVVDNQIQIIEVTYVGTHENATY